MNTSIWARAVVRMGFWVIVLMAVPLTAIGRGARPFSAAGLVRRSGGDQGIRVDL